MRGRAVVRVAVVDDNEDTLNLVGELVAEQGWEMIACPEGATAYDRLRMDRPDLIVLDLWLERPDSGWRILEQLKSDPVMHRVPVVMCSGNREGLEENAALLDRRVAAVLVKPFDIDDACRCLRYALSSAHGRAEREDSGCL